jgi:hypothetical protein
VLTRDFLLSAVVLLAIIWLEVFPTGRDIRVHRRGYVVILFLWVFAAAAGIVLRRLSPREVSIPYELSLFGVSILAAFSLITYVFYRGLPIWLGFLKVRSPERSDRYDLALEAMQKRRPALVIVGGVLVSLGSIIRLLLMIWAG